MSPVNSMMDATFVHKYRCERLAELPKLAWPHFFYPGASPRGGQDGILVKVCPCSGEPWLGTFAFGAFAPRGVSGIFTTPNPQGLCVVAKGAGYMVSVSSPAEWETVQATPIIDVHPVRARSLLVFATFTDLVAYGPSGMSWRTRRLSWDDLRITEVTDAVIRGEFWDIRSDATGNFTVDLATGHHEGGLDEG